MLTIVGTHVCVGLTVFPCSLFYYGTCYGTVRHFITFICSMVLMMVAFLGSMDTATADSPEVVASGNVIAEAVLNIKTVKALCPEYRIK